MSKRKNISFALVWTVICAAIALWGIFHEKHEDVRPATPYPIAQVNLFDEQMAIMSKSMMCSYLVHTFEEKQDSVFYQIANFQPFSIRTRDSYQRPRPARVNWPGKREPTAAQLLPLVIPYEKKARVLEVLDIKRERCWLYDPDQQQEEPTGTSSDD